MFGIDDAALALMLAGVVGTAGTLYTNSANRKAQKEINSENLKIARENNATQIEMANTAHQREIEDLTNAGLNPILSAGGSGASVPVLRSPEMGTWQTDNPVSDLASSAKGISKFMSDQYAENLRKTRSEVSQINAQTDNLEAQNENLRVQNENLKADNVLKEAQTLKTLEGVQSERYKGAAGNFLRTLHSFSDDVTNSAKSWFTNKPVPISEYEDRVRQSPYRGVTVEATRDKPFKTHKANY